jgi:hypothetical protein
MAGSFSGIWACGAATGVLDAARVDASDGDGVSSSEGTGGPDRAGPDLSADASADVAAEAGAEAGHDASVEAPLDASADVAADTGDGGGGHDATADASSDVASSDVALDSGADSADGDGGGAGCIPPPSGIVSWWRVDGNFDDSVGTNNGMNAGAVTFAPGEVGLGFSLAGTPTSYVIVPDSTTLELTGPITIDAWIKATALGGRIVDKIQANGSNGYLLDTYQGYLRFQIGANPLYSSSPLVAGSFTHVAGVYDGSQMTVYVDGAPAGTPIGGITAIPTNTLQFRMGADSIGGSLFSGIIDEVRVFARALSGSEIQAIYQQGSTPRCP